MPDRKYPPSCVTIGGWTVRPDEQIRPGWFWPHGEQDCCGFAYRKDGKPSVRNARADFCWYCGQWCPVGTAALVKIEGRWAVACLGVNP